jgi:MarR-like DNA-binding transcriptional regulator SgrR of sgrS sRNA
MRRVSISPWADKRISAEKIQDRCVYSWKPNPAPLAAITFDPEAVRSDVRETVAIAREHGCTLEIILKDTHTCNHEPERFDLWSRVAMEEAMAGAGVS